MSAAFWQQRKQATLEYIEAIEAMLLVFTQDEGVSSYRLDTGQSVVNVQKSDMHEWQIGLNQAINRYTTICQQLGESPSGAYGRGV